MPKNSHEVPLRERTENTDTYTEILAFLSDGKVYKSDPTKRVPQAAQKGGVCWYYALNRIRNRFGKNYRPNADRHIEKIISGYRKSLTSMDTFQSLAGMALDNCSDVLGIAKDEIKFGELLSCLTAKSKGKQDLLDNMKKLTEIKKIFSKMEVGGFVENEQEVTKFMDEIKDWILKDIQVNDEVKNKLKTTKTKLGFLESLMIFNKLFNEISAKDYPELAILKDRMTVFMLAFIDYYVILENKNVDALSSKEVINYLVEKFKVSTLLDLYKKLDLKASVVLLTKILTTGVYNVGMIKIAESMAADITKAINTRTMPDSRKHITPQDVSTLEALYIYGHMLAYSRFIELYDLQVSKWTPKQGFQGLTEAINKEGALVIAGKGIGTPAYKSQPQILKEEKETPVKIGSRTIKFWPNKDDLKPIEKDANGHVIIIVGTQSVKHANNDKEEYVFFLDPNDASIPDEERTVYRMSYSDLVPRIMTHTGVRVTDQAQCPDDGLYAVAARMNEEEEVKFSPSPN